jgi:molybdopterin converting factor small subunit
MSIHVRWSAALAPYTGSEASERQAEWAPEMTAESIARDAGLSEADRSAVLAFVNGTLAAMDAPLEDGDELAFEITIHGR